MIASSNQENRTARIYEIRVTSGNSRTAGILKNLIDCSFGKNIDKVNIEYLRDSRERKFGVKIEGRDLNEATLRRIITKRFDTGEFSITCVDKPELAEVKETKDIDLNALAEGFKTLARIVDYRTPTPKELEKRPGLIGYTEELGIAIKTNIGERCRSATTSLNEIIDAIYDSVETIATSVGHDFPKRRTIKGEKKLKIAVEELTRNIIEEKERSIKYRGNLEGLLTAVAEDLGEPTPTENDMLNDEQFERYSIRILDALKGEKIQIKKTEVTNEPKDKAKKVASGSRTYNKIDGYKHYDIIIERKKPSDIGVLERELKKLVNKKEPNNNMVYLGKITANNDPKGLTKKVIGFRVQNTTLDADLIADAIRTNLPKRKAEITPLKDILELVRDDKEIYSKKEQDKGDFTRRLQEYEKTFGAEGTTEFEKSKNKVAGFRRIEEELEGKKQELERTNIYIDSVLVLLANIAEAVEYKTEIEPKSKTKLATYTQGLLAALDENKRRITEAKKESRNANTYATSIEALLHEIAISVNHKSPFETKLDNDKDLANYKSGLLAAIEEKRRETVSAAEAKLREAAKVEEQKLIKTEARLEELKEIATALEKEKSELEMLVKENSIVNLTAEEILVEAFRKVYSPELNAAIEEYNKLFPEGIPENLVIAQTDLKELIYEKLGSRLIEIDPKLRNRELTIDELSEKLKYYNVEFDQTGYAEEHNLAYKMATLAERTFKHRKDESLNEDERAARELIRHYNDAKKEHYRIKEEEEALLNEIDNIKIMHNKALDETSEFRKRIPLNATFGCFSYHVQEKDGYRLRFVIPTNNQNFRSNAALDFSLALASTLKGRNAEIKTGELRNCYYIELVYRQTTPERLSKLIDTTRKKLESSDLAKVGAKIELKYFGDLRPQ